MSMSGTSETRKKNRKKGMEYAMARLCCRTGAGQGVGCGVRARHMGKSCYWVAGQTLVEDCPVLEKKKGKVQKKGERRDTARSCEGAASGSYALFNSH